jgi:apolipoprotein D and lipocalin family protein
MKKITQKIAKLQCFTSICTALIALPAVASSGSPAHELKTVSYVDLNRYAGTWYQIAFFPTRFQKNCTLNTSATYELLPNGTVSVFNSCTKPNGKVKTIEGTARVVDSVTQAKLKVKFFWFAPAGDYWVIDLGQNYEYAVVGEPKRNYLWILSRTPTVSSALYNQLKATAEAQGFDVGRLQLTSELQP